METRELKHHRESEPMFMPGKTSRAVKTQGSKQDRHNIGIELRGGPKEVVSRKQKGCEAQQQSKEGDAIIACNTDIQPRNVHDVDPKKANTEETQTNQGILCRQSSTMRGIFP
ncbi:hypothetical protein Aduo_003629 [Ancylostoma duodenale]